VSAGVGYTLTRSGSARVERWVPALALAGVLFGIWYAVEALGAWPYS
jgi:hypothetical protein